MSLKGTKPYHDLAYINTDELSVMVSAVLVCLLMFVGWVLSHLAIVQLYDSSVEIIKPDQINWCLQLCTIIHHPIHYHMDRLLGSNSNPKI